MNLRFLDGVLEIGRSSVAVERGVDDDVHEPAEVRVMTERGILD